MHQRLLEGDCRLLARLGEQHWPAGGIAAASETIALQARWDDNAPEVYGQWAHTINVRFLADILTR
jgi:hypothetical protein